MALKGFRAKINATCGAGTTGAAVTVAGIQNSASDVGAIRSITIGISSGAPADFENLLYIDRCTAKGTATSVGSTSVGSDVLVMAGKHRLAPWKENSAEPTYSSTPFYEEYLNQRVKEHIELADNRRWEIGPTASDGVGIRVTSTGIPIARTIISWEE